MSNYNPKTWINGVTPINATNLNHIESGISSNSTVISEIKDSMKFKGTTGSLPVIAEVGDVYQAVTPGIYDSNKIGDLLVCVDITTNPYTWHVIPSGDETNGTVTSVQAGNGLTTGTGPITSSGSLSLDSSYIANSDRNGLFSKEDYNILHTLANVAITGSFNSLVDVPDSAVRALKQEPGIESGSSEAVMSQAAITTALSDKSNVGHTHSISDVTTLSTLLAKENNNYVKAASDTHTHGLISRDGYFLDSRGSVIGEQYLKTNASGKIVSTVTIPSSAIDGVQFGQIDLNTLNSDVSNIKTILTPTGSSSIMEKAATENHTHLDFLGDNDGAGFVPVIPTDSQVESFVLSDTGWEEAVNVTNIPYLIDLIYPVGSYFETSSSPDVFDPNTAWEGSSWVLETEGLVHVSASASISGSYPVPTGNTTVGANNIATEQILAGAGVKNGGNKDAIIPYHTHNQTDHTHAISNGAYALCNYSPVDRTTVGSGSGKSNMMRSEGATQRLGLSALGSVANIQYAGTYGNTVDANMQPYINVYRWHRVS